MTSRTFETTSDASLAEALDRLAEELRILRNVLDKIRSELQWANRNCGTTERPVGAVRRVTSMPLDPAAPDWAERLNRFSAADVFHEDPPPPAGEQRQLF